MTRRLLSALLIALITSGGGGLPLLDGLAYHSRDRGGEILGSHYEASSGCHADGCSVRSTALQTRFAPPGQSDIEILVGPGSHNPGRAGSNLPTRLPSGQPHSRAPPRLG